MKILLGGIPLGCDNIGDEAIVACVVKMLKSSLPSAEIAVATADPGTAERLGTKTVPPFGFAGAPVGDFAREVENHDVFIWCGATGLSDYPHIPLSLLEMAQKAGKKTFVWGVGMDNELNPVFFKVRGKRRALLKMFGLVGKYEAWLRNRLSRRIAKVLPACRGVWLRDPESRDFLATMGFPGAKVGADSAIMLRPAAGGESPRNGAQRTLGLCISTQRQVSDLDGLKKMIASVARAGWKIIGIPMNPKTDRRLLESLGVECIAGDTPEAVIEAARKCDAVLSSRLHLLILAANAGTQGFGIARGSKLANWLANFGRKTVGSVYDCDWNRVAGEILASPENEESWRAARDRAYAALDERLETARKELVAMLEEKI